jgi:hypothetical protein
MTKDEPSENKRSTDRRRVFKAGKIVIGQGVSVFNCTVRNVSETGAMLTVPNAITLPEQFELRWDGNVRQCVVVWRKTDSLGVRVRFDK